MLLFVECAITNLMFEWGFDYQAFTCPLSDLAKMRDADIAC